MPRKKNEPKPDFDGDGDLLSQLRNALPTNPADLCLFLGAALKSKDTPEGSLPSRLSEIGEQVEKYRPLINIALQHFAAKQQPEQNPPKAKSPKVGVRKK